MLMTKDVSCHNFNGLLAYLRTHFGEEGVREVLNGIVGNHRFLIQDKHDPTRLVPVQLEHLQDPTCWVSNELSVRLLGNVRRVVKGPTPLLEAAAGAVKESLSKSVVLIGRIAGIHFLARKAAKINTHLNRNKEVILRQENNTTYIFELHYRDGVKVSHDVCQWNLGFYTQLAKMAGVQDVRGEETQCILHGADHCEIKIIFTRGNWFRRGFNALKTIFIKRQIENLMTEHERTVTERERLIDQLSRSEEKYRSVFENTGAATAILGPNASISQVNNEFEALSGYEKDELEGKKHLDDFLFPQDWNAFKKIHGHHEQTNRTPGSPHEFRFRNRTGHIIHVLCRLGVMPMDGRMVLSLIDISKRMEAEAAVRKKEADLSSIFRAAPIGIGVIANGVMKSVNHGLCEMMGYGKEELLEHHISMLIKTPMEYQRIVEILKHQIRESGTGTIQTTWDRKDGRSILIRLSATPIHAEEMSEGITFTALDITESIRAQKERERLAAQLRQAQKMEAIGTLAGGIAHDFNNILAAIIGYTEMTIEDLEADPALQRRLGQVLQASFRARDLVSQILTFSRRTEGEKHPFAVTPVIKEAMKLLRATLPSTITFKETLTAKNDRIYANATQLHQVLMNLCTNAKQAMCKNGGTLTVALEDIILDELTAIGHFRLKPGPYVRLMVSDTGHGISSEVAERIFEPYFTTKGKTEGTGLGLSVVHGIVQDNDGAVEMFSEPGRGSRFDVYFPTTCAPDRKNDMKTEGHLKGNERILLVDDEESLASIYGEMLESLGYSVLAKTDSRDALDIFSSQPNAFDLVLTDYTMPKLTGMQLADHVFKIRPDIPVVLYSGFAENVTPEKAKGIGIREMVPKPLIKDEISTIIRKCLDTRYSLS